MVRPSSGAPDRFPPFPVGGTAIYKSPIRTRSREKGAGMQDWQARALAHPLNRADIDPGQLAKLSHGRVMRDGNLLLVILAADR